MAVIRHEVQLGDGVSAQAKAAADTVAQLSREMTVLTKSLTAAQDQMTKAAATGDIAAYRKASQNVTSLTAATSELAPRLEGAQAELKKFGSATGDATAGTAAMDAELAALTGGLSEVIKYATIVIGVFAALTIAGAKLAIEASQAKMQMISMFDALGQGKVKGEEIDDMLDDLRASIGITKDAMVPLVKQFMATGVTGKAELEKLTKAALSAQAIMGDPSAAQAFTDLSAKIKLAADTGQAMKNPLKSLKDVGLSVEEVAKAMGNVPAEKLAQQLKAGTVDAKKFGDAISDALIKKGAGPLERMSGGVKNLGALLHEYIGDLFEDLGPSIEPFLSAVKDLFGIFESKTKPSGQALKWGIESFFKEVFAQATKVVPMVKHFLLDIIIYGLKAYIALKPIVAWFQELQKNETVMSALRTAFEGFKGVLVVIGVAIGVVLAVFVALWAAQVAIVLATYWLIGAITDFVGGAGKAMVEWVTSAASAAYNFVAGLVQGISNGTGMVIEAVKNLGGSAIGALKGVLGIASPSKVMMTMGVQTGEGFNQGLEASAPDAETAAGVMAGGAMAGASSAAPAAGGTTAAGGGVTVIFEAGAIAIDGAGKAAQEITEEMAAAAFERMALQGAAA